MKSKKATLIFDAPTRTGKCVGHIIPVLLSDQEAIHVMDLMEDDYKLSEQLDKTEGTEHGK